MANTRFVAIADIINPQTGDTLFSKGSILDLAAVKSLYIQFNICYPPVQFICNNTILYTEKDVKRMMDCMYPKENWVSGDIFRATISDADTVTVRAGTVLSTHIGKPGQYSLTVMFTGETLSRYLSYMDKTDINTYVLGTQKIVLQKFIPSP